ncbi:amino acid adenylation domain-containing protein [Massilia sp. CCM 8695]|uniref:Amino acid adenylation domain-containing protein n=1 Tax=Massilia frigida TaxID=2609281 RepID=A0ABX0NCK9_9BURK|nr:non-ribosomal peptide synthetase [Massilia frigida]NHZ80287.1 amino acid adenylation domain-containing protein [Massilia frigida]
MQHTEQQHDIEGFRPSVQQVRLWQANVAGAGAVLHAQLDGDIDAGRLRLALEAAVARHEILRTRLHAVAGMRTPVQVIDEHAAVHWLEAAPHEEAGLASALLAGVGRAGQPSLAAALVRVAPRQHRLVLLAPLGNADAATLCLLLREVEQAYRHDQADEPGVQYADFAEWQHEFMAGADSGAAHAFWLRQADAALDKTRHPLARRAPAASAMASLARQHDARWSDDLLSAAAGLGTTPSTILSVCWSILLQRQLGLAAVMLGWRHDGRSDATRTALGPYAKTLPLLAAHNEEWTLGALTRAQDALLAEAQSCHESASPADLPYLFARRCGADAGGAWRIVGADERSATHALCLEAEEGGQLTLHYDSGRFSEQAAALLLDQVAALAGRACRQPRQPLHALSALDEAQALRLAALNRTASAIEGPDLLHALFEVQAERRPGAVAVEFGTQSLTYGELNARANQLAHRLRRAGVAPETAVGLYAGRALEAVVGMLGILKAGGAYLPLDPAYPAERLAFVLDDTQAALVLTVAGHAATLPPGTQTLLLDDATLALEDTANPAPRNAPDSLAYIIYTSGSTGQPKGVMVSHRNAVHSTMARWQEYDVECESFLLSSSFAFDSSVAGLFWTLSQGARLCLPSDEAVQDADAMARLIELHRVSHVLMLASFYSLVLETAPAARLASLRCAIVAGEACPAALVARHRARCPQARLYNEYGPTEASVWCTLHETGSDDEGDGGVLPIGKAIANMRVHVLDKQLSPLPQGIAGDIYLGGTGIARGYLRRPDLSAERFIPDPFGPPGTRLYRTGDIGRFDSDGCLDFLGRIDQQVKIRGFRVELGEIEARLADHAAVREAAVVARADKNGDLRLLAYVVARGAAPASTLLQQHLQQRLPSHMVPADIIVLDAFPLTPNGKLDRASLSRAALSRAALPEPRHDKRPAYRAPRDQSERLMVQIWEQVLGAERIGLDDDFFALGGHSLVATRLVSRVRALLGREVAVRAVFQHPRLGHFAEHVAAQAQGQGAPMQRAARGQPLPLSFPQLRLWQFDREHPHSTVYNVPSAVRLLGELDRDAMQRAFDELVRRHEALRTTLAWDAAAGMPLQTIHPAGAVQLALAELGDGGDEALLRLLSAEEQRPFDLGAGPLMRAGLIRASEREHILWITLHHIVSDRWSMQVLVRELGALYAAFSAGKASPLPEPAFQYADFAAWQRQQVSGGALQGQLDFWTGQLRADQPPLHLPGMRPRPERASYRGETYRFEIGSALAARIDTLCREQGATPFMTMLAAFKALLAIRSGEVDVPVGILLANRNRLELEGLTGCLINMLALRAELAPDSSFAGYLGRVRDTVLAAQANQDVPFECVVEAVKPQLAAGVSPLFQVLFDVHHERILQSTGMGGLAFGDAPEPHSPTTHVDLMVGIAEREDGLRASFVYRTDLFDDAMMAELARDYTRLLEAMVSAPDTAIRLLRQSS